MTETEILKIKQSQGRRPFDARIGFVKNFAKCPFHDGATDKSLHLKLVDGGVWLAHCFSSCNKTWDVLSFVQAFEHLTFLEAVEKLGDTVLPAPVSAPASVPASAPAEENTKASMTSNAWATWGRELTPADVERLRDSRRDSRTPGLEALKAIGCRVKGDYIGFPYRSGEKFSTIKMRHLDKKEFLQEHKVSQDVLFNIDACNIFHDVYVVESELDAGVMIENGFPAVSVVTGGQSKFDRKVLEKLKLAPRIFLVGDQDSPGQECIERLIRHLPLEKTYRIQWPEEQGKDVGELAFALGPAFNAEMERLTEDSLESWVHKNVSFIGALSKAPVRWVADRIFLDRGLTILCGKEGAMKSLLALVAAHAVDTGVPFLGRNIGEAVPVLYLDRENPEAVVNERRTRLGIPDSCIRYWGNWNYDAVPDVDDVRLQEFAIRERGFLVFDSLQQWYGEANENDNTAMVKLMNKFRHLAALGSGAAVLHHDAKYGEKGYRGASALVNVADMSIGVTKTEGGTLELRALRFRGCAKWELDVKIHFDQDNYRVEVLRDDTEAEAVKQKLEKKKERGQARQEDIASLVKIVGERAGDNGGRGPSGRQMWNFAVMAGMNHSLSTVQNNLALAVADGKLVFDNGPRNAIYYQLSPMEVGEIM